MKTAVSIIDKINSLYEKIVNERTVRRYMSRRHIDMLMIGRG